MIHSLFFVYSPSYAESPVQQSPLIAVLVDSGISDAVRTDLQRYTTQYIQKRYTNSKAIVIPINTSIIKAPDIVRMLENIYFEGTKNQPSSLIGVILVGDIPLPVANKDGFIFPTILPYTDFEQQQYLFNAQSTYFEYNNIPNGQPEIWHGYIQL